ncbi:hypothetical protein N0V93_010257 [Gnomoniopsis smithogilvyi]|uniref:Peptidase S8/S53 domain-containing protein n=1 Tax=Gnomoniopsis smithogilvyi TaxID=1191159 RepID=A0A9W8YKZ0_9PEZI|nr:hypothetical protein N0V93_010257 [Gnomoniopsis smithogilvyi]
MVTPLRQLYEKNFKKSLIIAAIDLPVPVIQGGQPGEVGSNIDELQDLFLTPSLHENIRSQSIDDLRQHHRKNISSNYGNMTYIAFPARLHHDIVGMFSTNAIAVTSHGINPKLSENKRYDLAILGEGIKMLGPSSGVTTLNGTSMSTAIGAGLAVRLIDFQFKAQRLL